MKCLIGIGEINKNLYFMLLAVFFQLLSDFIYGVNYPLNNLSKSLYIYNSILKDNLILQSNMKIFKKTILN